MKRLTLKARFVNNKLSYFSLQHGQFVEIARDFVLAQFEEANRG